MLTVTGYALVMWQDFLIQECLNIIIKQKGASVVHRQISAHL